MKTYSVEITEKFPNGFAYHEIITDDQGRPIDCRFIHVNETFEKLTGLRKKDVLNRKLTEVIPEIEQLNFDWIGTCGKVAKTGESITFKQYSDELNIWYEVIVFSDREGYFSTIFRDITTEVLEKTALEEIVAISEQYLCNNAEALDYREICMAVRKISKGIRVDFHLYSEKLNLCIPLAAAGKERRREKVSVHENNTTGENTYVKTIEKDGRIFGKLTITMKPGEDLQNEEYIRLLVGILGQYFQLQETHKKLKRENEQMFLLFDHLDSPIYVVDMDTYEILYMNQVGKEEFGDIQGKTCREIMHTGLSDGCSDCPIPELKKGKGPIVKRRKEYYHEGKKCWYHRTDTAMEWPDGRRVKLTVAFDVSDRKKVEEQEQYLRTVMSNAHDSIIVTDENFIITYVNKKTEELFGYGINELYGFHVGKLYPEYERRKVRKKLFPLLKSGENYVGELTGKKKEGNTFFCEISASPIKDKRGSAAGYIGIQRDITEKKLMMEKLRQSNQRYDELSRHSGTVTWETDEKGLYTYVNPIVENVFGYSPEELIGKVYFYDIFIGEEKEALKKKFFDIFKDKKPFRNIINGIEAKNGDKVVVSTNGIPILNEDGEISGFKGIDMDITERVLLEEQRDFEKEKFKTTLLSVGDGIIATDKQGKITVMNKVAEYLTEWTQEEAYGRPFDEVFNIVHEGTKEACENPAEHVLLTGETIELDKDTVLLTKTGKFIPIDDSAAPIKGKGDEITGAVVVFRDYSEKRKKERQVEYLSFHDHLTGLHNRRYLDHSFQRLDQRKNLPIAVVAVDVNGLKLTNDTYGHDMGDNLLKAVATALKKACNKEDIIARTGGDEFIILLPKSSKHRAERVIQRVIRYSRQITLDSVIVSLAIGYAVKTIENENIWDVLKVADNQMYKNKVKHGKLMRSQTIETVLRSINLKYDKEQIHTERVSLYCEAIAKALGLPEEEVGKIKTMGVLHDIGKITVSPNILNKVEKLTENEWSQIKQHPVTGYNILKSVEEYEPLAYAVLHHHERWDGSGYPGGLKGKEIPYYARIVNVADAFEAMTAQRAYHTPKTNKEASAELIRCAGTQFDPEIVKVFVEKVLGYGDGSQKF